MRSAADFDLSAFVDFLLRKGEWKKPLFFFFSVDPATELCLPETEEITKL